jgi:hypothetical protein
MVPVALSATPLSRSTYAKMCRHPLRSRALVDDERSCASVRDPKVSIPGLRVQRPHVDVDQQGEGVEREQRVSVVA